MGDNTLLLKNENKDEMHPEFKPSTDDESYKNNGSSQEESEKSEKSDIIQVDTIHANLESCTDLTNMQQLNRVIAEKEAQHAWNSKVPTHSCSEAPGVADILRTASKHFILWTVGMLPPRIDSNSVRCSKKSKCC